jgi:hypothetical protein
MIVFNAPAEDEVSFLTKDKGVALPQGQIAGGHDIRVGDEPQGARFFSGPSV